MLFAPIFLITEIEEALATVTVPGRSAFLTKLLANDDLSSYDSLKQYLGQVTRPSVTDDSISESLPPLSNGKTSSNKNNRAKSKKGVVGYKIQMYFGFHVHFECMQRVCLG